MMTPLLTIVVHMTLLTFVSIMLGALLRNREWTPEATPLGGRAERAADNTKENFMLFVALALTAQAAGVGEQATFGATVFFWARVAYLPVYLAGITYVRSAIWGIGVFGLASMVKALI
jgi:uncharacterized MAPEG superfamily protein